MCRLAHLRARAALAATVLGCTLAFASTAAADAVDLRPNADGGGGWREVHAPTAWEAVDDDVGHGAAVAGRDLIRAVRRGSKQTVGLDDPQLPAGTEAFAASAHVYASAKRRGKVRVEVAWGGETQISRTIKVRPRGRWFEIVADEGPTATEAHSAELRFTALRGRRIDVRAAYLDLRVAPAAPPAAGDAVTPAPRPVPRPPDDPEVPPAAPQEVTVLGSTTTVRPDRPTPAGAPGNVARLVGARNEFESFQVAVQAINGPIEDLSVVASALQGPGGATIPAADITVYREAFYEVAAAAGKPRSSRQGGEGRWPDALIPERDPYYGEDRAAFPVDVPGGAKEIAWVDVFIDSAAPPGSYTGTVEVRSAAGQVGTVPVELEVANVGLPSTSSLRSAFLITPPGYFPCRAHRPVAWCYQEEEANWKLDYLYTRAALENRVTIPNGIPGAYEQAPLPSMFARYVLPLIDGTDRGGIADTLAPRLQGATLTTVATMWQCIVDARCLGDWRALAAEHGFEDRFIAYVCDEPFHHSTPEYWNDWGDCRLNASRAQTVWPGVTTLVTATIQEAQRAQAAGNISIDDQIDTLAAPVNYFANRPGEPQAGDQRPAYDSFLADGSNELWLYTACPQFSCDELEAPYFDNWPSYAIDAPASHARAMGWMSDYYDVDGELSHNVALKLDTAWEDQYAFGGNGDGTLFYPGSPTGRGSAPAIGGSHDIPIESIRLKRVREGREDYELLQALRARGQGAVADQVLLDLVGPRDSAMFSANVSQGEIDAARCGLLTALDPGLADCSS